MKPQLKPLSEQVMVILGGSSGIGREVARRAASSGAKVVVAARSEPGLDSLVSEITSDGGQAIAVPCEISDYPQVEQVGTAAIESFGRIDTWVNVAGVSVYATFENTSLDEFRRIMDVNLMGYVHGAKVAIPHLKQAGGGALIMISSVEGLVSLPLHSAYATSKHAIEGLVDAIRRELMAEGAPISVTSIKPASIDTPFFNNARSKIGVKPKGAPPIYEPDVVADCVLFAASNPARDLYAGGAGKALAVSQIVAPGMLDMALAKAGIPLQKTDDPASPADALHTPRPEEDRTQGDFSDQARRVSLYTWLETHPAASRAAGLTAAALIGRRLVRRRQAQSSGW
jgi:NAD(P)-dependent dehydrogenase (short-subunit alcohol dehydrogenase family)